MSFHHQWIILLTAGLLIACGMLTGCATSPGATTHRGLERTDGEGAPPLDPRQSALDGYLKAAAQGDVTAQSTIGMMYADGQGVPQDFVEAEKWFRRAAVQGHASAQFLLGLLCASGEGVTKDRVAAAKWFGLAANQGHTTAQFLLGLMFARGEGVAADKVQAYQWLTLASAGGNEDSKKARERLRESMTQTELAEAQRLADEFQHQRTSARDSSTGNRSPRHQSLRR